jgi:hypothetical protein
MATVIIVTLFISHGIWLIANIIAINKIILKRLATSGFRLSKSEWFEIGKRFLFIIGGLMVFVLALLITYYFAYWRSGGFHIYY